MKIMIKTENPIPWTTYCFKSGLSADPAGELTFYFKNRYDFVPAYLSEATNFLQAARTFYLVLHDHVIQP